MFNYFYVLLFSGALLFSSCGGGPFNVNKEGGTVFTIETSARDFLIKSSGYSTNPIFIPALQQAQQEVRSDHRDLIVAFIDKIYAAGGTNPSAIFALADREKYNIKMGKEELLKKLMEEYSLATDRIQHIIDSRLEKLGVSASERNVYKNQEGRIVVEVANGFKKERLRKLVQVSAEFGFYETYENKDAHTYLQKINDELSAELYPGIDTMPAEGSEYQHMKYPLFRYLQPDIHQGNKPYEYEFSKGCRVGLAKISDTAAVNALLKKETTHLLLPPNLFFLWSLKPESADSDVKDVVGLYAIKANSIYNPVLSGNVVTEAHTQEEENSGGARLQVSMTMTSEGAQDWKRITEANIDKAIAMVIDGKLISAPIVIGAIPNGESVISGNFTLEEAEDMALLLKTGSLPAHTRIIDEKQVEPKK